MPVTSSAWTQSISISPPCGTRVLERFDNRKVGVGERLTYFPRIRWRTTSRRRGPGPTERLQPREVDLFQSRPGAGSCRRCRSSPSSLQCEAVSHRCSRHRWLRRPRSVGTSQSREIFALQFSEIGSWLRQTITSGWMPRPRSSVTECCVGLVFCSPEGSEWGTSVRCR